MFIVSLSVFRTVPDRTVPELLGNSVKSPANTTGDIQIGHYYVSPNGLPCSRRM